MDIKIEGNVAPGFKKVKKAFAKNWDEYELGASCSVVYKGTKAVDIWGGYLDTAFTVPWTKNTLVNVYSTTKGMASLAVAILADEGKLDYEALVVDYWPEFGAEGKQNVTVGQLLSHQAGVCGVGEKITVTDLYNWEKMVRLLAAQKPFWEPGTKVGYHAITWGYLAGELIWRITGQTIGTYFREKVAEPLGVDFFIGLPDSEMERVSNMNGPNRARIPMKVNPGPPPKMPPFYEIALMNPSIRPYKDASSYEWRKAEIPAANGQANARAIARVYGMLANGGEIDKIRIISQKGIETATALEIETPYDSVIGRPHRLARGFVLNTENTYGPNPNSFGHGGAGGSLGFADPDTHIGFGYAMNQMQVNVDDESRAKRLVDAVYDCIG